jgi:putative transposase
MRGNLFWLSDDQWQRIAPLLPKDVRGKDRVDDRRVISGILHVLKSGCRWSSASIILVRVRAE